MLGNYQHEERVGTRNRQSPTSPRATPTSVWGPALGRLGPVCMLTAGPSPTSGKDLHRTPAEAKEQRCGPWWAKELCKGVELQKRDGQNQVEFEVGLTLREGL